MVTGRGFRSGDNPQRQRGHLDHLLPKPSKISNAGQHRGVAFHPLPELYAQLSQKGKGARSVAFLTLSAARLRKLRGARRGKFDFGVVWRTPA